MWGVFPITDYKERQYMSDIYIYNKRLMIASKDSPDYHVEDTRPEIPKDVELKRGKKKRRRKIS